MQGGQVSRKSFPNGLRKVCGVKANEIFMPENEQDLLQTVCNLNESNKRFVVLGNNTRRDEGLIEEYIDAIVSTRKMNKIIEYNPSELYIKVQPGLKVKNLIKTLKKNQQIVPRDFTLPEDATVGGMIASGAEPPFSEEEGHIKNMLLGSHIITPDGLLVKNGGVVVKNVAGYDLTKTFFGSYGGYVIYSEITLKVEPIKYKENVEVSSDEVEKAVRIYNNLAADTVFVKNDDQFFITNKESRPVEFSSPVVAKVLFDKSNTAKVIRMLNHNNVKEFFTCPNGMAIVGLDEESQMSLFMDKKINDYVIKVNKSFWNIKSRRESGAYEELKRSLDKNNVLAMRVFMR